MLEYFEKPSKGSSFSRIVPYNDPPSPPPLSPGPPIVWNCGLATPIQTLYCTLSLSPPAPEISHTVPSGPFPVAAWTGDAASRKFQARLPYSLLLPPAISQFTHPSTHTLPLSPSSPHQQSFQPLPLPLPSPSNPPHSSPCFPSHPTVQYCTVQHLSLYKTLRPPPPPDQSWINF